MANNDSNTNYDVERQSLNVINVNMEYKKDWEQTFLLISDVHFDNPDCDRKLLKKHLDKAVQDGCGILVNGDWFCAMESRNDPRSVKKIKNKKKTSSSNPWTPKRSCLLKPCNPPWWLFPPCPVSRQNPKWAPVL